MHNFLFIIHSFLFIIHSFLFDSVCCFESTQFCLFTVKYEFPLNTPLACVLSTPAIYIFEVWWKDLSFLLKTWKLPQKRFYCRSVKQSSKTGLITKQLKKGWFAINLINFSEVPFLSFSFCFLVSSLFIVLSSLLKRKKWRRDKSFLIASINYMQIFLTTQMSLVMSSLVKFVLLLFFFHLVIFKENKFESFRAFSLWNVYFGLKGNHFSRRHFGVFIVNFEQISHIVLVIPLLTLNKYIPAGIGYVLSCPEIILVLKLLTSLKVLFLIWNFTR